MYYQYWGLQKPPFDNVPDPSMYVECHASMENAIAETLFAIEEGDECISVIVGDVGLGKTMTIRMIIDSLDPRKYRIALITNPGISFVQILQEIIGQLTGSQCLEKRKVSLLERFNQLLFATCAEGKKILIFIDEANAITPLNLEQLRLLTNMQSDKRNLFLMVLAGQIEFGRRLEHPKRANLFQRVGTYSRIDKLESPERVRKYVETRLMLAGAQRGIFADDAFDRLWEQSDRGIPRMVNKLSKLCLKAGETNGLPSITGEIVEQIGARFHKLTGPVIEKRRSRGTNRREAPAERADLTEEREFPDHWTAGRRGDAPPSRDPVPEAQSVPSPGKRCLSPGGGAETGQRALRGEHAFSGHPSSGAETALPGAEAARRPDPLPENGAAPPAALPDRTPEQGRPALLTGEAPPVEPQRLETNSAVEMCIGETRIRIDLPGHLMKQTLSSSAETRFRLAGGLAAETLKKHRQLIESISVDPVPIWVEIRDAVLNRMAHAAGN